MIPFHMAFAIDDKKKTRWFYGEPIGCKVGREAEYRIDSDFFEHQIFLEPHIRFEGRPGEQGTFFLKEPAGNALEIKSFRHAEAMFEQ